MGKIRNWFWFRVPIECALALLIGVRHACVYVTLISSLRSVDRAYSGSGLRYVAMYVCPHDQSDIIGQLGPQSSDLGKSLRFLLGRILVLATAFSYLTYRLYVVIIPYFYLRVWCFWKRLIDWLMIDWLIDFVHVMILRHSDLQWWANLKSNLNAKSL